MDDEGLNPAEVEETAKALLEQIEMQEALIVQFDRLAEAGEAERQEELATVLRASGEGCREKLQELNARMQALRERYPTVLAERATEGAVRGAG